MRSSARHFRWFRSVPKVLDFLFRSVQLFVDRRIRDGSVPARLGTEGGEDGRPARKKKQEQIFVQCTSKTTIAVAEGMKGTVHSPAAV